MEGPAQIAWEATTLLGPGAGQTLTHGASSQGTWVPSEEPASLLSCTHLSQTQAGDVAMATVPAATREAQ